MYGKDLPIIIGANLQKGLAVAPSGKGFDMYICWLKSPHKRGESWPADDIDGIQTVIHFTDELAIKTTIKLLKYALKELQHADK